MEQSGRNDRRRARGRESADEPPVRRPATSSASGETTASTSSTQNSGQELAIRPSMPKNKRGTTGSPVGLIANYFEVTSRPSMHLFQYRVDFSPDIEATFVRKGLVGVHSQLLGKYIFDGTLLYSTRRLYQPSHPSLEVFSPRRTDQTNIRITFRLVGEIQKGSSEYDKVVNLIFRRCLSMLNLTEIKRNFFDSEAAEDMPNHRLTFWPGYHTSIAYHDHGYLLNVEIKHKALRTDTAYDVMRRILDETRHRPEDMQNSVKAALEGQVVMTLYNKKTYKVDDIAFDETPMSTFHMRRENREISYMDYCTSHYPGVRIKDPRQFLLVCRPSRRDLNRGDTQPIRLIPELCGMTGLTEEHRKNFHLMRDVAQVIRLNPDRRVEKLMRFRRRLQDNARIQSELDSWGLEFSSELVRCPGRVLPFETIQQGNQRYQTVEGDWSRAIQRNRYCSSPEMKNWLVVYPERLNNDVRNFIRTMRQVGQPHNFIIPDPFFQPIHGDSTSSYINTIREGCLRHGDSYDMVLIVLPNIRADTYMAVKRLTLVDFGIPSQVITHRVMRQDQRRVMSVATKVTIQVASKLGAEPWRVQISDPELNVKLDKCMVIGYDTYHDARQSKAVGAFVASINRNFTRYNSSVQVHSNNEEISPSFRQHMFASLKAYSQENGRTLPEKIIVYRDGVGAGDIARLREIELAELRAACQAAGEVLKIPYKPRIAFIVVSKRINTRFFTDLRPFGNPSCGTVVDRVVTLPDRCDFFLIPQKTNQGSVSPTSFNIIEDTTDLNADIHQRLANKLTHIYFNWPGALRIPGPIQYAHKLAYLVGESLNLTTPNLSLSKLPYYL